MSHTPKGAGSRGHLYIERDQIESYRITVSAISCYP